MRLSVIVLAVVVSIVMIGCSSKEQLYENMYNGLSAAERNRRTQDPSYDPVRASEQEQPKYRQYKREREENLAKSDFIQ